MTGFSPAVRRTVRTRADGWCELCGYEHGHEAHHRRARGMGGTSREDTNTPSNALFLCRTCHRMVEMHRNVALVMGWLVPQQGDPASTPVVYRGRRVVLDDLGNLEETAA